MWNRHEFVLPEQVADLLPAIFSAALPTASTSATSLVAFLLFERPGNTSRKSLF